MTIRLDELRSGRLRVVIEYYGDNVRGANLRGADGIADACDNFAQQAETVFDAAAIFVITLVGARLQELIQQIAIGRVNFDTVESGRRRPLRRRDVVGDNTGQFARFQSTGSFVVFLAQGCMDTVASQSDRRRRHRQGSVVEVTVGGPSHVPQLKEDPTSFGMHGLDHLTPGIALLIGVDARRPNPAIALGGDGCRFGDDQPGAGPLGVIFGYQAIGNTAWTGLRTGHRRQDHPVVERQIAHLDRVKQCRAWFSRTHQSDLSVSHSFRLGWNLRLALHNRTFVLYPQEHDV